MMSRINPPRNGRNFTELLAEGNQPGGKEAIVKMVSTNSILSYKISCCFAELLTPTLQGRKSKLVSRKLRAMSMKVNPTYQRLEDLEGILHDNLCASSWADETNPIYNKVAASEVQNYKNG